jgi:hypothetical protein
MRRWPVAIPLLVIGSAAAAQQGQIHSFTIVEAGIYTPDITSSKRDPNGVVQNMVSHPQLTEGTKLIPAKIGVSFGFRYRITGLPEHSKVPLRVETRYPPPGARPPGSVTPLLFNLLSSDVSLNTIHFSGYTLAEPWELIPGTWTISVWLGERKLGEQQFTVVRKK